MACAISSSLSAERAAMSTVAPAAATLYATASPMPNDAPVTNTVAPETLSRKRSGSTAREGFTSLSMTLAVGFIRHRMPRMVRAQSG